MHKLTFNLFRRRAVVVGSDEAKLALKQFLSFYRPGYRFSPMYKKFDEDGNRLWDGKESFVKYNAISVGLLLGAQKELKAAGFKIKVGRWAERPFAKKADKYDYQQKCVDAMTASLNKGGGLVLASTGSGKTAITGKFFKQNEDIRGVFIVDQVHLLYQSQKEIEAWAKEPVGIVGNGRCAPKRITVATIQTLQLHKKQLAQWFKTIDIMFIDELHKQMGRRNFKIVNDVQAQAVIGLTATMEMKKKEIRWKCYSICGPVLFEFPIKEGVEKGVLSKSIVIQVEVK